MKVRKMLFREETEKVLHTKSNGDKLVAASSGDGYTAFTRDNVRIGHISAETDAAAVAEFSKKEPKYESMNEDYLDSAEYRIQRYEDDIPELFHRVHDGYMNGMVNAKAYADVLAKIYSVLEELDYVDESLKESYMDTHEGVDGASVGFLGGQAGQGGTIHDTTNETADDNFMNAEKMERNEFNSHQGKLEDIEFVMTEYIADSILIEFVKKVDATTWLVGVEDEVVTVKFDPSWSEYVYTIDGKGPYSHSSYEYISRDVYDFVMSQRTGDEYDDDFDDLSSFNECSDVKRADALYGVERNESLTEARYTDTNGIMGRSGATYSDEDLRKAWEDGKDSDPSMQAYNGDFDAWKKDTIGNMSKNEAFDMSHGPDLGKMSWQVASYLDVDALGEDKWIEFICDDARDTTGGKKSMRFEAIGEDAHMYGFIKTNGDAVDVQFRNGSEAVCHSAEEVARFIAGEFGISI